jgi:hypothetical protein
VLHAEVDDLVRRHARVERSAAGETLAALFVERTRAERALTRPSRQRGSARRFASSVASAAAPEALVNLKELELDVRAADVPTGLALILPSPGSAGGGRTSSGAA